jgi:hypothetical protein
MANAPPPPGVSLPPLAPPPTMLGLNASNIHTFQRAMLAQVSLYGQTYTPMYENWAGDSPRTPAMLSTKAISSKVQWCLAFHSGIQSYIILHDPFIYPTAPVLTTLVVTRQFGLSMMSAGQTRP